MALNTKTAGIRERYRHTRFGGVVATERLYRANRPMRHSSNSRSHTNLRPIQGGKLYG